MLEVSLDCFLITFPIILNENTTQYLGTTNIGNFLSYCYESCLSLLQKPI